MDVKVEQKLPPGDLHATGIRNSQQGNTTAAEFDGTNEDALGVEVEVEVDRQIWLEDGEEDLLGVDDASMFYADFPPLPDFSCMSSSSSSSSTPVPTKAMTCSSAASTASSASSAASWAVLKSDTEQDVDKNTATDDNYQCHVGQHDHLLGPPQGSLSSTASMEIPQPSTDQSQHQLDVADCVDVMENFGYMDLLGNYELFDPSSIFQSVNPLDDQFAKHQEHEQQPQQQQLQYKNEQDQQEQIMMMVQHPQRSSENNNSRHEEEMLDQRDPDDLGKVFLEWLKSNRETVSADDLRSVKLKKSTIECATRRLGGGKEAMKQLLKLVLEWVQTNHLQKRKNPNETQQISTVTSNQDYPRPTLNPELSNPNPNVTNSSFHPSEPNANPCVQPHWVPAPPFMADPSVVMAPPPPFPQPMIGGYISGDPYSNGTVPNFSGAPHTMTTYPPPHMPPPPSNSAEYHMLEPSHSWPPSQFVAPPYPPQYPDPNLHHGSPLAPAYPSYGGNHYPYQYFQGPSDQRMVMRLGPSATKEARKKRMARQRRYLPHSRHQQHQSHQNTSHSAIDQHARLGTEAFTTAGGSHGNTGNWVYWPSVAAGGASSASPMVQTEAPQNQSGMDRVAMQPQNNQSRGTSDKRQAWKPEKNLKFLLQKVLKQSDVGNLGRIVLPKKEAETHLPELEARDGISIDMEDIGTSRVWNMRYRYWPNNKSRMYLLENTGEFVRANGLQEGDFIVIYSDVKCGKYMIRGVKVRQCTKSENKRAAKLQKSQNANANAAATPNTAAANCCTTSSSSQGHKKH